MPGHARRRQDGRKPTCSALSGGEEGIQDVRAIQDVRVQGATFSTMTT